MTIPGPSLPDWVKRIESKLECPVCYKTILDPPVYVCVNIHILCDTCHEELRQRKQKCPQCRGDFTGKRDLAIENILDLIPKTKCPSVGCTFAKADAEKVAKHTNKCKDRLVRCHVCGEDVPISGFAYHQVSVHECPRDEAVFGEAGSWLSILEGGNWSIPITVQDGEKGLTMFYNIVQLDGDRQLRWISHNQSKEDTEKYEYSISLLCGKARDAGKAKKRIVKFSGYCLPIDASLDTIKDLIGLNLSEEFLSKYADQDNKVPFEYQLYKAKDEENMQEG